MAEVTVDDVVELLREMRPDLADEPVTAQSSPENDLGLDSLDLIQLSRLLRKRHGVQLDLESWRWKAEPLGTILDHLQPL